MIFDKSLPFSEQEMESLIIGHAHSRHVWYGGHPLSPEASLKVRDHIPDGFCWGYGGSGPAQLALAILLRLTSEQEAICLYQDFKSEVIATLPQLKDFVLKIRDVQHWIAHS